MTALRPVLAAFAVALPHTLLAQAGGEIPVVTLSEARRLAAAVDPASVAARGDVSTAGWERRAALADLFTPNVNAGATYIRFSDPFFNFGTGDISPNATSATLEASYTVLGAGKLAELRRSKASVESAVANETAQDFRTALATDAAYYAVLAEDELAKVTADRLRRAEEQLAVARVRVQAGETIATDSLQLMLEVIRVRFQVLQRDSARAVSQLRLGRQIGSSGPAGAAPLDTGALRALPVTLEAAVAELRDRGPEVEAARAAERFAGAAVAAEYEGYLPDLSLSATTGAYDSEFFPSAFKRTQLAVTLSWRLWDAGQRELAVARARVQRDVARSEREARERATGDVMTRAYSGYETARAGIELAEAGVAVSTETYRVQGARYREGATTILDLLEAQVALGEAEAALVQARYAGRLALAEVEALLGRRLFADTR